MSFDRDELTELLGKKRAEGAGVNRSMLRMLSQAAVSANHLTADPSWDIFLSYLQDMLEKATKARDGIMLELARPDLVNPDAVLQRRIGVIRLNERIDLLNFIIAMPKDIKKTGTLAAEQLKELEEAEAV